MRTTTRTASVTLESRGSGSTGPGAGGAGGGCRPVAVHPDSDIQRRGAVGSGDSAQASVL